MVVVRPITTRRGAAPPAAFRRGKTDRRENESGRIADVFPVSAPALLSGDDVGNAMGIYGDACT